MWVKICGIREQVALDASLEGGADAVGFVFCPSRRRVDPEEARPLAEAAAGRAMRVGVFQNQSEATIRTVLETVPLDAVQLAGEESERLLRALDGVYRIKSVALEPGTPFPAHPPAPAEAYLLDRRSGGRSGGLGLPTDWSVARSAARNFRLILAGGLRPETVGEAVRMVRPWGVDVSSGVELQGTKDPEKIRRFIAEARRASAHAS